jgi:glycosyltransferase involved in cell wall biosynthesis
MPVYNGATYLGATLDALLKQDFRDFEVLCMDDCSTDGSAEILQAYAERDARVRLIRMPANLGCVPLVINQCKEQIRGDWCVYTSQDDLFSVNWLSSMHARALVTGADAVIPDVVFYYENEPARQSALVGLHGDRNAVLSGRDAVLYSLNWTIPGNALWRSSMVRELGYADFATNADEYTARVFFLHCQKVVFCDGQFLYRQDNPGAITKKITPKTFDLPYTFVQLAKFLLEQGFPIKTSRGELHKAMRSLSELKTWLQTSRHLLSSADIADAENRVMRCEAALNESAIQELLTISESAS